MNISQQHDECVRLMGEVSKEIKRCQVAEKLSGEDYTAMLDQLAVNYVKLHVTLKYLDEQMLTIKVSIDSDWVLDVGEA